MKYLVSNITFNGGNDFECGLPLEFSEYGVLSKPFLRAWTFYREDLTFDYTKLPIITTYDTEVDTNYQCIADLSDAQYDKTYKVSIKPLHKSSTIVWLSQDDININFGDVQQAIFEKLMSHLDVDFLVSYLK